MIPVIDLGPFLAGQPAAFDTTAKAIGRALQDIGFFVIAKQPAEVINSQILR